MKILEAQSAILTNYEVYTHLQEQRARYEAQGGRKRRGPGNLETVVKELLSYFRTAPSPLQPPPGHSSLYNSNTIRTLLERLRPYELSKAEMIMIMNLRPTTPAALNTVVQEMEERFPTDEEQETIVEIIREVLGSPDGESQRKEMEEGASRERERMAERIAKEQEAMEIDGSG